MKYLKKLLGIVLVLVMVSTIFTTKVSLASSKSTLSTKGLTISLGTNGDSQGSWGYNKGDKFNLSIKNSNKKAKYTCQTSNKDIVTAKVVGDKIYLIGIKAGTATITCNQKINKKTTLVGKCKVTVQKSIVGTWSDSPIEIGLGKYTYDEASNECFISIQYRSANAKYTYSVDKKGLTVEDKLISDGSWIGNGVDIEATKTGEYKVTVKETYNKKSRTVGTVNVIVHDTEVKQSYEMAVGDYDFWNVVTNYISLTDNYAYEVVGDGFDAFEYSEDSIIYLDQDYNIHANKVGKVSLKIYYWDLTRNSLGEYIGSCEIVVNK